MVASRMMGEAAGVCGGLDLCSEADGLKGAIGEFAVFGEDAGVPGAAAGGDHAGDEVGEDAGEDECGPALVAGEFVEAGGFLEVGGDGHGSGDDVEEDVPLGSEEHEGNGADAETAADLDESDEQDGEEGGGGDAGQDLGEGLDDAGELGVEADGDADGDGPGGGDEQGMR